MSDEWNLGWLRRSQILVATGVTRCKETKEMVFDPNSELRRSDILIATGVTRQKKTKEKYSEPRRGSMFVEQKMERTRVLRRSQILVATGVTRCKEKKEMVFDPSSELH